jgi:hypothetical protein
MTTTPESQLPPHGAAHRRWYDHDPVLLEVFEILKSFQAELREQAQLFVAKIESEIGKDALEAFFEANKPANLGNRWYDHDPVLFRAIELMRVVPPDMQRRVAQKFLDTIKKQGLVAPLSAG